LDFTFLILDVYGELFCESFVKYVYLVLKLFRFSDFLNNSLVVYEQEELGTISLPDIAVVVTLHNSLVVLLFLFL
jgi:hypothetical protein